MPHISQHQPVTHFGLYANIFNSHNVGVGDVSHLYTPKVPALYVLNNSLFGVTWYDAAVSTTHSIIWSLTCSHSSTTTTTSSSLHVTRAVVFFILFLLLVSLILFMLPYSAIFLHVTLFIVVITSVVFAS